MSMPLQETAVHGRSELAGLSSVQAASVRAKLGPNAVVEEPVRSLFGRFARHFWAQVPAPGAIVTLILGDERKTLEAAAQLRKQNIFIPAIRYPTVARGAARLRVTLTASHSADEVSTLVRALEPIVNPKS